MSLPRGVVFHFALKFFLIQVIGFLIQISLVPEVFCELIRLKNGETIYEYDNQSIPLGKGNFGWVFKGKLSQLIQKINNYT